MKSLTALGTMSRNSRAGPNDHVISEEQSIAPGIWPLGYLHIALCSSLDAEAGKSKLKRQLKSPQKRRHQAHWQVPPAPAAVPELGARRFARPTLGPP